MSAVEPSDIDPEILRRMDTAIMPGHTYTAAQAAARVAQQIRDEAVQAERDRCLAIVRDVQLVTLDWRMKAGLSIVVGVASDRIKAGAPCPD